MRPITLRLVGSSSATVITLNPNNTDIASAPTSSSSQTYSLTSAGDDDGDGQTNALEVTAGTNPLDASSIFKIKSIAPATGGGITVTWDAVSGKSYTVESTANLVSGPWTPLASGLTTGTYTDASPGSGNKFYRVKTGP